LKEKDENKFFVIFQVSLADKRKSFKFKAKATAHFETNERLTSDFVNSPFARINAPAIAFPYIRVFISNFTLSGYHPVMLPAFNFVEMAKETRSLPI